MPVKKSGSRRTRKMQKRGRRMRGGQRLSSAQKRELRAKIRSILLTLRGVTERGIDRADLTRVMREALAQVTIPNTATVVGAGVMASSVGVPIFGYLSSLTCGAATMAFNVLGQLGAGLNLLDGIGPQAGLLTLTGAFAVGAATAAVVPSVIAGFQGRNAGASDALISVAKDQEGLVSVGRSAGQILNMTLDDVVDIILNAAVLIAELPDATYDSLSNIITASIGVFERQLNELLRQDPVNIDPDSQPSQDSQNSVDEVVRFLHGEARDVENSQGECDVMGGGGEIMDSDQIVESQRRLDAILDAVSRISGRRAPSLNVPMAAGGGGGGGVVPEDLSDDAASDLSAEIPLLSKKEEKGEDPDNLREEKSDDEAGADSPREKRKYESPDSQDSQDSAAQPKKDMKMEKPAEDESEPEYEPVAENSPDDGKDDDDSDISDLKGGRRRKRSVKRRSKTIRRKMSNKRRRTVRRSKSTRRK